MDTTFLEDHFLDIATTLLGLAYILLEYKASVWLWLVGFVMQALDIVLYYDTDADVYFSNTAFSQNVGSMQFKIN